MIYIVSSSRYKFDRKRIKKLAQLKLMQHGYLPETVLTIALVGRTKMRLLSKTYKKEDIALPVLSFPFRELNEDDFLLGEVIVCYPQAILLAAQREKKVDDIIISLVEHGINNLLKV